MTDILTADRVNAIFTDCLFRDGEPTDPHVEAEGIVNSFGFHPDRLSSHKAEIGAMLRELPDPFHADKGGGWTFLNACNDRHGRLWTGLHQTMEQLFVLGIATEQASYVMPREMWSILPGGMPYIVVNPVAETATA